MLAAVLIAFLAAQQEWPANLRERFAQGVEAQKAGRLAEAESAFREVLSRGMNTAYVHNNLGLVYQQRAQHEKALGEFRIASRLDPKFSPAHVLAGASLLALGRLADAIAALETGVRLDPKQALARVHLGTAYERSGRFADAVAQLREARRLAPREPEYAYRLGRAYFNLSAQCYEKAVRGNPDTARAHQIAGEQYLAQGRLGLALKELERAAAADPALPDVHLLLAQVHLKQGDAAAARAELDRELAIMPSNAMARLLRTKLGGE